MEANKVKLVSYIKYGYQLFVYSFIQEIVLEFLPGIMLGSENKMGKKNQICSLLLRLLYSNGGEAITQIMTS